MSETFRALVVREQTQDSFSRTIENRTLDDLPPGDVLIQVLYSSINYKDALSASGNKGVTRRYPHTPGVDASGIVVSSSVSTFVPGDRVICTGYDLGMNTDGGYGEYIRVPADWVVPLPQAMTCKEAMIIGTAGFTAAQCVQALQENGITAAKGPIVVSGATGGVGVFSILLLAHLGYQIHAVSGKENCSAFLQGLGVESVLPRETLLEGSSKLLLKEKWAGGIDTVGGEILANIIKSTGYDGVVTACGNASSGDLPLSVYPFILRGVHLVGIYSANCPKEKRLMIWDKLATEWKLSGLETISQTIGLSQVSGVIDNMLAGKTSGRTVVQIQEEQ